MHFIILFLSALIFTGCTTLQVPSYIKGDHPYSRKMYGDFDKISAVVRDVVVRNGWKIQSQVNPSVYERIEGKGQDTSKDLLLFTNVKQHSMVLYSSYTHLNIYLHAIADGVEVEIRYGKLTPLGIKQFSSTRADSLANKLLDQIERDLVEGK